MPLVQRIRLCCARLILRTLPQRACNGGRRVHQVSDLAGCIRSRKTPIIALGYIYPAAIIRLPRMIAGSAIITGGEPRKADHAGGQ